MKYMFTGKIFIYIKI